MTRPHPPAADASIPSPPHPPPQLPDDFDAPPALLDRPDDQRLREHKYRFSQAAVFGLPVLFLQFYGRALGGPEAERWVAVLQALLAGWVTYVAATGMLFEGVVRILARRRAGGDLAVAVAATAAYVYGAVSVLYLPFTGRLGYRPILFHVVVVLLAGWTAFQWWRWSRRAASADVGGPRRHAFANRSGAPAPRVHR